MKKFSKLMAALLALVMCLSLLPMAAFAAEEECDHNWVFDHVKGGQYCTTYHTDVYKCTKCGKTDDRLAQKPGSHNLVITHDAVDMGSIGKYDTDLAHTVKCTNCGFVGTEGHTYAVATCTAPETCACGKVKLNSEPLGHSPIEVAEVPATCQKAGTAAGTKCSTCGTILSGMKTISQKEHSYTGDCVQKGTGHAFKCVNGCDGYGPMSEHTGEWKVVDEPTCTVEGSKTFECTACDYSVSQKIPATGHKDEDGDKKCDDCDTDLTCQHEWMVQNTYEATCTTIGYKVEYCDKCKTSQTIKTADKLGHGWDEGEVITAATCTEGGVKTFQCTRSGCDATKTEEVEKLGHTFTSADVIPQKDATCTEDGMIAHYHCDRCEKDFGTSTAIVTDFVIPALGHTPGDPARENEVAATETTGGSYDEVVRCTVCNEVISSEHHTTQPTGTVIVEPDVPLGGEVEIDEVEVPLAGLMTRAEFVNYLYVQAGSPEAQAPTFTDVPEDYEYAAAIGWAQANGIAQGVGNNEFAPDDLVTVEQARLFLERYAKFQGIEMPELTALIGKERDEILDNADEVLAEFFGEEYAPAGAGDGIAA